MEPNHIYSTESWITEDQLAAVPYSEYWNDAGEEKNKFWDISDGNFQKLERGLERNGLPDQFRDISLRLNTINRSLAGTGASLGCGTCWLEAYLIKSNNRVNLIYCVEFSKHRIFQLAPLVLKHYEVQTDRIKLCFGSFYELKIESNSLDFIILCQTFYIADYPDRLLTEIKRVLKPSGIILILAEHYHSVSSVLMPAIKHAAKWMLNYKMHRKNKNLWPEWSDLLPYSSKKGNHRYSAGQYRNFFLKNGFAYVRYVNKPLGLQNFILYNT